MRSEGDLACASSLAVRDVRETPNVAPEQFAREAGTLAEDSSNHLDRLPVHYTPCTCADKVRWNGVLARARKTP
jgi:hypothetical protein